MPVTNEPTEAQVKAAAKALRADEGFMEEVHSALDVSWSEYIARLVLVAAQGAAPQQIGRLDLARHYWRSQGYDYDLHGLDGNNDYEMGLAVADAALAALSDAQGAAPQAECDCGAGPGSAVCKKVCATRAPVLPSSGVDEDALAEVILAAEYAHRDAEFKGDLDIGTLAHYQARAVAAWLKDGAQA